MLALLLAGQMGHREISAAEIETESRIERDELTFLGVRIGTHVKTITNTKTVTKTLKLL